MLQWSAAQVGASLLGLGDEFAPLAAAMVAHEINGVRAAKMIDAASLPLIGVRSFDQIRKLTTHFRSLLTPPALDASRKEREWVAAVRLQARCRGCAARLKARRARLQTTAATTVQSALRRKQVRGDGNGRSLLREKVGLVIKKVRYDKATDLAYIPCDPAEPLDIAGEPKGAVAAAAITLLESLRAVSRMRNSYVLAAGSDALVFERRAALRPLLCESWLTIRGSTRIASDPCSGGKVVRAVAELCPSGCLRLRPIAAPAAGRASEADPEPEPWPIALLGLCAYECIGRSRKPALALQVGGALTATSVAATLGLPLPPAPPAPPSLSARAILVSPPSAPTQEGALPTSRAWPPPTAAPPPHRPTAPGRRPHAPVRPHLQPLQPVQAVAAGGEEWERESFSARYTIEFSGVDAASTRDRWHGALLSTGVRLARSVADECLVTLHWLLHLERVRANGDSTLAPSAKLASSLRFGAASTAALQAGPQGRRSVDGLQVAESPPGSHQAAAAAEGAGYSAGAGMGIYPDAASGSGDGAQQALAAGGRKRPGRRAAHSAAVVAGGSIEAAEAAAELTALVVAERLRDDSAECARQAAVTQAVLTEARRICTLPSRAIHSALAVVIGGRLRLLGSSLDASRVHFVRVSASTSTLWCDGVTRGTLLGALPGLSARGEATMRRMGELQLGLSGCCFRLVLKTYELDAVAISVAEMTAWVRGVNWLPLGAKHVHLAELVSKHHLTRTR